MACMQSINNYGGDSRIMTEIKFRRWFDTQMFVNQEINACLKSLAEYVGSSTCEWHLEFRKENTVFLYCSGYKLEIKFLKRFPRYSVKISDGLKKELIQKNIAIEDYLGGQPLEKFNEFIGILPDIQSIYKDYPSRQQERKYEFDLAKGMNSAKQAFVIDTEIVVSNAAEYCSERKNNKKGNPEGDLLLLVRNGVKYWLLPVEMKRTEAGAGVIGDAEEELKTLLNVIYGIDKAKTGFFKDFKNNYQIICKHKKEIGLLKDADIEIEIIDVKPEKPLGLILFLTNGDNTREKSKLMPEQENQAYLISAESDPYSIYSLKCDKAYFQSCEWVKQLK